MAKVRNKNDVRNCGVGRLSDGDPAMYRCRNSWMKIHSHVVGLPKFCCAYAVYGSSN